MDVTASSGIGASSGIEHEEHEDGRQAIVFFLGAVLVLLVIAALV